MAEVADWNPVDDSNDTAPPVGAPEGMMPSAVNNTMRAMLGALRREHDRLANGSLNLPYLPVTGGTVSGNIGLSGTAGVFIQATQLSTVSNGLQVYNASGGSVFSRGPSAGFNFGDRDLSSGAWEWYANAGNATIGLAGVGARVTVNAAGNMAVAGSVNATLYGIDNLPVIDSGGGGILIYDGAGQVAIQLYAAQSIYRNNAHLFANDGGGTTATIDASGNFGATASVTAPYLHSTGGALVDGNFSAANLTATSTVTGAQLTVSGNLTVGGSSNLGGTGITANINCPGTVTAASFVGNFAGGGGNTVAAGTVNSTTVNNSGTITTQNLSASSNVTASGTVTGGSMVCNGTMQVGGQANLLSTLNVGPSGGYMRADGVGTYNVSGNWLTFSDRSVKEAITSYTAGLAEIERLEPVSYTYTSEIEQTPVTRYGLIADDVAPIIPEMVGQGVTPGGQTMSTLANGHLTFVLINACKTLAARVSALEQQVAAQASLGARSAANAAP